MSGVIYGLDMAGVIVFALSGVILACRSRMDPFGMLVLAAVTGIGGDPRAPVGGQDASLRVGPQHRR